MKNLILLLGLSLMFACSSTNNKSKSEANQSNASKEVVDAHGWHLDYAAALNKAKDQNKHVLVLFTGSDWCRPCMWLEKDVFETEQFKSYAKEKLVIVKADFPRRPGNALSPEQTKKNRALSNKFGIRSFPTVFIVDNNGQQKQSLKGYGRTGVEGYMEKIELAVGG